MKQISYHTYAYLKSLIDRERQTAHSEYVIAVGHIQGDKFRNAREEAWQNYRERLKLFAEMEEELHDACKAVYKDHPNPEMRRFWCIDDADNVIDVEIVEEKKNEQKRKNTGKGHC